ncbi:response regulator [Massilia sp. PAMC28688]|uniref:response regulator n=1 Tax=Massilia sp. PAMC28688 TaxID=2861283 RepID=UPI001C63B21E|nr:response regulator [Massilia sp. PAMC28688]QYF93327.1 response regulator [Massilia sp. PAMC28688]
MQSKTHHSLPSIRSKTAKLVLACLLPTLIGLGALLFDAYQRERAFLIRDAEHMAQTLQSAIEYDLQVAAAAAVTLAASPSLGGGDLAAFHQRARAALDPTVPVSAYVLSDLDGKALLSTAAPWNAAQPGPVNRPMYRPVSAVPGRANHYVADNLSQAGPNGAYRVLVHVVTASERDKRYVLTAEVPAAHFRKAVAALKLPPGWAASVLDRRNVNVANSVEPERYIGRQAGAPLIAAIRGRDAGVADLTTSRGLRVFSVFTRSPKTGFVSTIGVPREATNAALRTSLASVFLSVAGLLTIGFGAAWVMGGNIGRAVRNLRLPAVALGRGEPVIIPPGGIRETEEVGAALKQVEQELNRFRSSLEDLVHERTVELENANALIKNMYGTAPVGLSMLDTDLRIVMVNDYLAAINNKPVQEHIGKTLPELLGPQGEVFERAYRQVRDTGEPLIGIEDTGEVPYAPGVEHHWVVSYHPVFNNDQVLVGVSGLVVDVSESKQLSAQLRDVSEQFHVLFEMSGDAHLLTSIERGYVGANRAAAQLFGCRDVEHLLTLSPATTSPEFQPDGRRSDEKALQFMRYALERGSHQFEWLHQRVDGTLFNADILLTSLQAGGKGVIQATVRDISERIAAEARLQSLNEQLAAALDHARLASQAKSEFLANMSHEIRTPMNAIMGLARLLDESQLARRERSYVAKIKMSTRSLLGIINDVLDFSKIEAGQLTLEYTAFHLDQVLDSISVLLSPSAAAKGLELVYAVAPDVPLQLMGDPMRLEQVLLNLISNAIKFTEQGEVVLTIGTGERSDDSMTLAFSVRDSGIGIAADHQPHMFDPFSQADSSTSRKYGGTGLGLTICKRLVGLMGGSIAVDSALGEGADFRFTATFGLPQEVALACLPPLPCPQDCRVLVVDDNDSARDALASQLSAFGWQVTTASDGHAALELLQAAGDEAFEFMLLDAAMPGLDGISVLTYARADRQIQVPRTALMIADQSREQLASMADDLRLDATISKPVTRAALVTAIVELHTGLPAGSGDLAETLAGKLEGIYVLLVEDNQINQEVANYLLLHAGAAVDIAANGREAVELLAAAPTRYDAVLMDIQMPEMNGYQATEAIRRMGLADLPIIAMTANVMEDDRARAINAGMNGHIAKPIDVDHLIGALLRVISGGEAHDGRALPRLYGKGSIEDEAPLPASIPGIDLRSTLPRFGGNFGNFVTLFKRFERSQGGTLAEVRHQLRAGEREQAQALVHRLRGVAANLGAAEFAAMALEFEHAIRHAAMPDLVERLDLLETQLSKLLVAARQLNMPLSVVQAPQVDARDTDSRLADLLGLLQNNNLKALAEFDAVRPALAAVATAQELATLSDAVATLAFASAATHLRMLMDRKEVQ